MAQYLRPCVSLASWGFPNRGYYGPASFVAYRNRDFYRNSRTPWARFFIRWDYLQPTQGLAPGADETTLLSLGGGMTSALYLLQMDDVIRQARLAGCRIVLCVHICPRWANSERWPSSGPPPDGGDISLIPPDDSKIAGWPYRGPWWDLIAYLVQRYTKLDSRNVGSNRWVDFLEVLNEPNQWALQGGGQGSAAYQVAARMMRTAHEVLDGSAAYPEITGHAGYGGEPLLMGPSTSSYQDPNTQAGTKYDQFTDQLADRLRQIGFNENGHFAWSHHNYDDVEFLGESGAPPLSAVVVRGKLQNGALWRGTSWHGWPYADPARPYLTLTEGGARIEVVGSEERQKNKVVAAWDLMRKNTDEGAGIGMFTNYLFWSAEGFDSGLCQRLAFPALPDWQLPFPGHRPVFTAWTSLQTTAPRELNAPGWNGWTSRGQPPGGALNGAAAAAGGDVGRFDVVVRATDGALWHRSFDAPGERWSAWTSLGTGGWSSDPAAASWITPPSTGELHVFVRGPGDHLWHRVYVAGGGWSAWEDIDQAYGLGGTLASAPAACSWEPGRLDIFGRGLDGRLRHTFRPTAGGAWAAWETPVSGTLTSAPTAASWAPGRLDVFARGQANDLLHWWYENGWGGPESLGGLLTSGPAACAPIRQSLFVGVRLSDNTLQYRRYGVPDGWSTWTPLGGGLTADPEAASWGAGRADFFARDSGGNLSHRWLDY